MRTAKNRERIIEASIELFNQNGVVPITTNHIASHLSISPGNLYFHYANKEAIIRELFDRMCRETYLAWKTDPSETSLQTPTAFIERSFEVYWKYRFFHREMYHLRRKDPLLAKKWKAHLNKTVRLLYSTYNQWVKSGIMKPVTDPGELQMIADVVLITSSIFLQFFESKEKPATRRSLRQGLQHIMRFLLPYYEENKRAEAITYLQS